MALYFVGVRTPGMTHYYRASSRAAADQVAQMAAKHAPGRVWIEGELSASGRAYTSSSAVEAEHDDSEGVRSREPARRAMSSRWYVGVALTEFNAYYPAASREAATRQAAIAARRSPSRLVWIEGDESASGRPPDLELEGEAKHPSPEVLTDRLESVDGRLKLSAIELVRRDKVLAIHGDVNEWQRFAVSLVEPLLASYRDDELKLDAALEWLDRVSIGCRCSTRMSLLGTFAYLALRRPRPEPRDTRRPPYPKAVKIGTADLILHLEKQLPTERLTPGKQNRQGHDPSSPLIDRALEILNAIEFFSPSEPPSPATIADWVRARRKETEDPSLPERSTGRPGAS